MFNISEFVIQQIYIANLREMGRKEGKRTRKKNRQIDGQILRKEQKKKREDEVETKRAED